MMDSSGDLKYMYNIGDHLPNSVTLFLVLMPLFTGNQVNMIFFSQY